MDKETTSLNSSSQSPDEESDAGAHLALEKLADYYFREVSLEEEPLIKDHLALCDECASMLLDLAAFYDSEGESVQPSPSQVEAAWARVQAEARDMPPAVSGSSRPKASLFERLAEWLSPLRPAHALAALSLIVSLFFAFWMISLSRENRALVAQLSEGQSARDRDNLTAQNALAESARAIEEAQRQRDEERERAEQLAGELDKSRRRMGDIARTEFNFPIETLSQDAVRTSNEERPSVKIPAGAARFTLIIAVSRSKLIYPDYAIKITDARGDVVLERKGLRPVSNIGFTVALPTRLFTSGEYRFNVYGLGRGAQKEVAGILARIIYE